jgi:hypothetical protein
LALHTDLGLDDHWSAVSGPASLVILLDTTALIWVQQAHPRIRKLIRGGVTNILPDAALKF